jgi:F-type H+-transporting ATPase subunit c
MKSKMVFLLAVMFVLATPIFAADGSGNSLVPIAAGFSMAIASAGCGLAQGKAVAAACEGMGRNPGAAAAIRFALILGLVFIESLSLYTLVIVFTKV